MPALALEIGLAAGPAFEGVQGRKPRSAGRAVVMPGAAMGIAWRRGAWTVRLRVEAVGR
jgi:hypothetical protein